MKLDNIIKISIQYRKHRLALNPILGECKLSANEFEILYFIHTKDITSPSKLAEGLFTERASISRFSSRLEELGYITSNFPSADRRLIVKSMTKEGTKVMNKIIKLLEKNPIII